ncbi:hypothetical protein [Thermococcus sp. GR6]|uniref:hypothetical protein n=1 Tax=Thermococcus sp. GR6 TaxID=1638256 RepID=UPI001431096C|nr:hypothetical protein [Thermococcus sp. GR6]NJE42883.1 hypothetical protein [Thermococcus sp. GR6]
MTTWGLWYYKWNGSEYEVLSDWNDQKFDYIIVTDGGTGGTEGLTTKYSGVGYNNGYNDAGELIEKIENQWLKGRNYIVEIPYFIYQQKPHARDLNYWLGWIDGAAAWSSSRLKGFYWSLENIRYIQAGELSRYTIETIWGRIMENRREYSENYQFIWIPSLRSLFVSRYFSSEQDILEAVAYETDVPNIANYFNNVFIQPGYYFMNIEGQTIKGGIPYTYSLFVDILKTIHKYMPSNVSIEMEADGTVRVNEDAKDYACKYVDAQREAFGYVLPDRAYYFDTEESTIDYMRTNCPGW